MNFTTKSTGMKCAQFLLLVLVHCCALSLASIESNGERENKVLTNSAVVNSLTKETVDAQDALAVNKRNVPSDAFLQKMSLSAQSAAPMHASPLELEKAQQLCQQLFSYTRPLSLGIRFKKSPFDDEGIRYKKSSPFAEEGIRYKKSPFDEEGIRYKKSSPFAEEGIRFKKSPFDDEGIRYKKSPFDAEGIRFKKSPFEAEGIRFKKSPFDAEGIRFKKSPFDDEGIRYKKSPFDDEGIRY